VAVLKVLLWLWPKILREVPRYWGWNRPYPVRLFPVNLVRRFLVISTTELTSYATVSFSCQGTLLGVTKFQRLHPSLYQHKALRADQNSTCLFCLATIRWNMVKQFPPLHMVMVYMQLNHYAWCILYTKLNAIRESVDSLVPWVDWQLESACFLFLIN